MNCRPRDALPIEEEAAGARLGLLGHRSALHARIGLPGLHGGESRLQVAADHGRVQEAGDAVRLGAARHQQGQDHRLQGEPRGEYGKPTGTQVLICRSRKFNILTLENGVRPYSDFSWECKKKKMPLFKWF